MTNTGPFLWNGSSKFHSLLIYDTLSVFLAVEASQCFFFKHIEETQISKPLEATRHSNLKKNIDPTIPQSFRFD